MDENRNDPNANAIYYHHFPWHCIDGTKSKKH
jgi:hypothetical protein